MLLSKGFNAAAAVQPDRAAFVTRISRDVIAMNAYGQPTAFAQSVPAAATIDLRSDTVTLPTPRMREAMARAELGDDVYGEDPSVNKLESMAAEVAGKEAALLVVSGTMGNLTALLSHCTRGQRVILGDESHIYNYEAGGGSALGGLVYHTVPNLPDGTLHATTLERALIKVDDPHYAPPGVLCLENTHNRCGGAVLAPEYLAKVHAQALAANVPLHLDGARVFNAAVALGVPVARLTAHVDSVQFCLSKGLSAPVGSMLAGSKALIDRARRVRKMLGGGMRQAGVIAAAGMVALDEMVERLSEDHANARVLAKGLAGIEGIAIDPECVHSDIVVFELVAPDVDVPQFLSRLSAAGVRMSGFGGRRVRAVTHYGITTEHCERALEAVRRALAA
jgi:threonine aldolase